MIKLSLVILVFALALAASASAQESGGRGSFIRSRLQATMQNNQRSISNIERTELAGLKVAIWRPAHTSAGKLQNGKAPLILFSHGFHGTSTQSNALMTALSQAGYFVAAPDHADANLRAQLKRGGPALAMRPDVSFASPEKWTESTYKNRGDDLNNLLSALQSDDLYRDQIDFDRLALVGHSLGGYTVLGLAGAWASWKMPGVKAVVALSPFCTPYLTTGSGNLSHLGVPVMYQGGTRDNGITPALLGADGAFAHTSKPAALVSFEDVGHFSFSNFNRDRAVDARIADYAVTFIDHYLNRQDKEPGPYKHDRGAGVAVLEIK